MQCLVVKAHPLSESLCSSLSQRAVDALRSAGHQVTVEDLYAEGFDAALTPAERAGYYAEVYPVGAVEAQAVRLLAAEAVVLVFPTWWFGFPAILKGWFDRVWGPGVAFDHAAGYKSIKPRLNNLRRMLAVTSLGSPWWVDHMVMGQPVKRLLKTGIAGACAPNCRFEMFSLYNCEQLSTAQVERFAQRVERTLVRWEV
ncbi:MAG: NAD(P)H-dependent oxidoreductase [Nitrospirota bacterium]